MKTRISLILCVLGVFALAWATPARAAPIFGPWDKDVPSAGTWNVTTLTSADVSGMDELVIEYTCAPSDAPVGDTDRWTVLEFNNTDYGNPYSFTGSGDGAFLTKGCNNSTHDSFHISGSWEGSDNSSVQVSSSSQHAVRITLSGLNASGGFSGSHSVTFEITHNATTVGVSADRTCNGTVDFGSEDDGLDISVIANEGATEYVRDLTITPEPATLALMGLGLGGLLLRRRRR